MHLPNFVPFVLILAGQSHACALPVADGKVIAVLVALVSPRTEYSASSVGRSWRKGQRLANGPASCVKGGIPPVRHKILRSAVRKGPPEISARVEIEKKEVIRRWNPMRSDPIVVNLCHSVRDP